MSVAAARPQEMTEFRYGTRQRFGQVLPSVTYASGGRWQFEIPRVGFLSALLMRLSGTMTLSATGVLATRGPWDLNNTLKLRTNIGATTVYETTGYGNYIVQRLLTRGFDIQGAGGTPTADADLFAAPVASGANTWALTYYIPVSVNYGRQFEIGLINLQAPEIQVNLDGRFGAPLDVVTLATGFVGTLDAGYLYYELPNPDEVMYPPVILHRTIEDQQTIAAIGDQRYTTSREGLIWRLAHIVQTNDVRTNGVARGSLKFNKTDTVYELERWQWKWYQHYMFGALLPVGVFVWDFENAEGYPGEGDNRDAVSVEDLSTLESIVNVTAAVGGTLNRLDTVREFTQIVAQ